MLSADQIKRKSDDILKKMENAKKRMEAEMRKREILKNYEGDDEVIDFDEIVEEIRNELPRPHFGTNYGCLDRDFGGGFIEGDLVLVAGFSGDGKTSL